MEDYPVSCQDYALFHFDEPFEQTEYCKQLDQPLNSKSILILTKSKASLPRVKRLVKAARVADLEVYVREYFAKAFADNKHVHPVEKNSVAYYNAMATSRLVYTDTVLYTDFVKRPGQILLEQVELQPNSCKNRIHLTTLENKSDYHIQTKSRNGNLSESALLRKLALRRLRPQTPAPTKTNLLFVINFKYYAAFYPFFTRLTQQIDYDQYDVTLLMEGKFADQYAAQLEMLDARVHLAVKKGKMLCDAETNRRLAYLKGEHHFIDNAADIDAFLPDGLFQREQRRLLGSKSFDCIFNLKYDVFYWRWLLRAYPGAKVIANLNNYTLQNQSAVESKTRHIQEHTYSLFLNQDALDAAAEFDRSGLCSACTLLPYIPTKFNGSPSKAFTITMPDEQKMLVVSSQKPIGLDTLQITTIPAFDTKPAYLVLDNHIPAQTALQQVQNLADRVDSLVVFDFFSVFQAAQRSAIRHADHICYINLPNAYISMQAELGDCYLPCRQYLSGVRTEAMAAGHTIHYFDETGQAVAAPNEAPPFDLNAWLKVMLDT